MPNHKSKATPQGGASSAQTSARYGQKYTLMYHKHFTKFYTIKALEWRCALCHLWPGTDESSQYVGHTFWKARNLIHLVQNGTYIHVEKSSGLVFVQVPDFH